jgi:hypothetical protein
MTTTDVLQPFSPVVHEHNLLLAIDQSHVKEPRDDTGGGRRLHHGREIAPQVHPRDRAVGTCKHTHDHKPRKIQEAKPKDGMPAQLPTQTVLAEKGPSELTDVSPRR